MEEERVRDGGGEVAMEEERWRKRGGWLWRKPAQAAAATEIDLKFYFNSRGHTGAPFYKKI